MFEKILHRSQCAKLLADFKVVERLNLSIPILIGIFIFFNPSPYMSSIKEICFYTSFFGILFLFLSKKANLSFRAPLSLPFVLFALWVFLGIFFALDKQNTLHDFYSHLLRYIVLYYILINFFGSRKRLVVLCWTIIISSAIFSFGCVFYFYFVLENSLSIRLGLGNVGIEATNLIGIITLPAIIFSLNIILTEKHLYCRIGSLICLVPLFAATILTQARSAFMATAFGINIYLIRKNKKMWLAFNSLLIIVFLITPIHNRFFSNISSNERLNFFYLTVEIIKDYPIIGIGFGGETYKNAIDLEAYNEKLPTKYRSAIIFNDPHSMLPSIAVRTGMVGLALFFYILFVFSKMCWTCIKHGKDDFPCFAKARTGYQHKPRQFDR